MQGTDNAKTDLLYLRFDDREQQLTNQRLSDHTVLDVGANDQIVGIEILDASRHTDLQRLLPVEYVSAGSG